MTLVNSQPQSGWELSNQPLSSESAMEAAACSADPSSNSYKLKQMGLFITSFSGHRDSPSTGPGARLIPWFLPGQGDYPDQKQSKYSSLRASSLSMKNSTTIYLSCLIEDITGELGYVSSILYSSFSTLLLYQAPFPNPPTSIKQPNNHYVYSSQTLHLLRWPARKGRSRSKCRSNFLPTIKYCTLSLQSLLLHQLSNLPKALNTNHNTHRSKYQTNFKPKKSFKTAVNLATTRLLNNQLHSKSINQNGSKRNVSIKSRTHKQLAGRVCNDKYMQYVR